MKIFSQQQIQHRCVHFAYSVLFITQNEEKEIRWVIEYKEEDMNFYCHTDKKISIYTCTHLDRDEENLALIFHDAWGWMDEFVHKKKFFWDLWTWSWEVLSHKTKWIKGIKLRTIRSNNLFLVFLFGSEIDIFLLNLFGINKCLVIQFEDFFLLMENLIFTLLCDLVDIQLRNHNFSWIQDHINLLRSINISHIINFMVSTKPTRILKKITLLHY